VKLVDPPRILKSTLQSISEEPLTCHTNVKNIFSIYGRVPSAVTRAQDRNHRMTKSTPLGPVARLKTEPVGNGWKRRANAWNTPPKTYLLQGSCRLPPTWTGIYSQKGATGPRGSTPGRLNPSVTEVRSPPRSSDPPNRSPKLG
jgi:hypothetical protein